MAGVKIQVNKTAQGNEPFKKGSCRVERVVGRIDKKRGVGTISYVTK